MQPGRTVAPCWNESPLGDPNTASETAEAQSDGAVRMAGPRRTRFVSQEGGDDLAG